MTGRTDGVLLMVVGAMVVVAGIVRTASSDTTVTESAAPSTITTVSSTTTTEAATTTSTATTTTQATTTTVPAETVDEFVAVFSAALASGDTEFVYSRLHLAVVALYGEDLCRAWTEREIMALGDYQLAGPVDGPTEITVSAGGRSVQIPDVFTAPIRFAFQGETFDTQGQFALVDGEIHWLGECR